MKRINLSRVEMVKPFIDFEDSNLAVVVTEVSEIEGGFRLKLENIQNEKIQFLKFYTSKNGLPFYKKFIADIQFSEKTASNPMSLVDQEFAIKTVFVNEKLKITKIVECFPTQNREEEISV